MEDLARKLAQMDPDRFLRTVNESLAAGGHDTANLALLGECADRLCENQRTMATLQANHRHEREHAGKLEGKLREIQSILTKAVGTHESRPVSAKDFEREYAPLHAPTDPLIIVDPFSELNGEVRKSQPTDPDATGWVDWHGGECPLHADTKVEIRRRDGHTETSMAGNFVWYRSNIGPDIVAYRLRREQKP